MWFIVDNNSFLTFHKNVIGSNVTARLQLKIWAILNCEIEIFFIGSFLFFLVDHFLLPIASFVNASFFPSERTLHKTNTDIYYTPAPSKEYNKTLCSPHSRANYTIMI